MVCELRKTVEPLNTEKPLPDVSLVGKQSDQSVVQERAKPTVFLGDATDDLESVRDSVEQYLRQFRVQILDSANFPVDAAGHQSALTNALAPGVVFVQLLSHIPGRKLGGERLAQLQYRVAHNLASRVLQWRDPSLMQLDEVSDANRPISLRFRLSTARYCMTEVRLITLSAEIFARSVRMSS